MARQEKGASSASLPKDSVASWILGDSSQPDQQLWLFCSFLAKSWDGTTMARMADLAAR